MISDEEIAKIVRPAKNDKFWQEVLMPIIDSRLANLDTLMCDLEDPWLRYGICEAYKWMKGLKELLMFYAEQPPAGPHDKLFKEKEEIEDAG